MTLVQETLKPTSVKLVDYEGRRLQLVCVVWMPVQFRTQKAELSLVIVVETRDRPALFGRNWLKSIKLDWKRAFRCSAETSSTRVCRW